MPVQIIDAPRSLSDILGQQIAQGLGVFEQRQRKEQQGGILSRMLSGEATEEERAQLDPEYQLKAAEIMKPKAPIGGITGQPVPPEISSIIPKILEAYPGATADELAVQFDTLGIPRTYSNSYIENRRRQDEQKSQRTEQRFKSERAYQSQRSMPFMKKLDEERASLDEKDQALFMMKNAFNEGNLTFFSKDNFANFLGKFGEGLRTQKGAQLINSQKEFLLSNIARAGARPNMYIEQQISKMLPQIGRSDEANLGVVESFQARQDVERKKQQLADGLIEKYEAELGFVPGNIASQRDKAMKPYAQKIQNRLAYRLRNLQENEMGEKSLKKSLNKRVTQGTPLTLQMAVLFFEKEGSKDVALKKAKKLGYYIPSHEEYKGYIQ